MFADLKVAAEAVKAQVPGGGVGEPGAAAPDASEDVHVRESVVHALGVAIIVCDMQFV